MPTPKEIEAELLKGAIGMQLLNKPITSRIIISGTVDDPRRPGLGAESGDFWHEKVRMPNSSILYHSNHLSNDQYPHTRYDHSQLNPPPEMPTDGSIEAGTGLDGLRGAMDVANLRHSANRKIAPLSQFESGHEPKPQRIPAEPPPQMNGGIFDVLRNLLLQ